MFVPVSGTNWGPAGGNAVNTNLGNRGGPPPCTAPQLRGGAVAGGGGAGGKTAHTRRGTRRLGRRCAMGSEATAAGHAPAGSALSGDEGVLGCTRTPSHEHTDGLSSGADWDEYALSPLRGD